MSEPTTYSFQRYLEAKKTVDDRALNRAVLQQFARLVAGHTDGEAPVRVLELGAGIGTMIERLLNWDVLPERVLYTAVDMDANNVKRAVRRLPEWAEKHGAECTEAGERSFYVESNERTVTVEWEHGDVFAFLEQETERSWDVLIGKSFLDLMNVPVRLPGVFDVLVPGGTFYFPITFDGVTILEPTIDEHFDEHVYDCYHETMDHRIIDGEPAGDSKAGRHLFQNVREAGGRVAAAGSSDWVVFATEDEYPEDEAYFVHHIVHMIDNALRHHPAVDNEELSAWISQRHHQIDQGQLVYMAHQLDMLGTIPSEA